MGEFKVGDRVTWTHAWRRGKSINFTRRSGIISEMRGDMALCKRKGTLEWVGWESIRGAGETCHLTKMVMGGGV